MEPAVVSSIEVKEEVKDLCANINCDDANPCTVDSCSDGKCIYVPQPDETSCGFGMVCKAGKCVEKELKPVERKEVAGINLTVLLIVLIVVVLIVIALWYMKKK
jgi:hypothetical protein